mgnify:CR=1 FL=1
MPIYSLFPDPVYFSTLERALTKEELKTINKYKKKTYSNEGNITSTNNDVLNNKTLKNLKKDLYTKVMDYFDKIVCTTNPIVPYITQSWLNYTETDQFHHRHSHSNSLISGIFYISADKNVDSVTFYKNDLDSRIKLDITKHNPFNSTDWKFPVETRNIVLFRSSLVHGVDKKKGKNMRISLSFNVFVKGRLGSKPGLTELVLE